MSETSSDTEAKEAAPEVAGRPRWWALGLILAAGAGVAGAFQGLPGLYRGLRIVGTMATGGAVLILIIVWILALSRLSRKAKTWAMLIVLLPIVAFFALRRIDTWDGDMYPITAWRWEPRPLEEFEEYLGDAESGASSDELRASSDDDFPGFLGKNRTGVIGDIKLATDWKNQPPKELWRHPVGLGWSAFAVAGDYAITQEQRRTEEPLEECVVAYELRTGRQIWVHSDPELFTQPEALGGDGPRATPTIDGDFVYALGATGVLSCLELKTGKKLWSTNILTDAKAKNIQWGMAGSPLIVDDLVIVCPGGDDGNCVIAYDKKSGDIVWRSGSKEETGGYASPILTTLDGTPQVVMLTGIGLSGYEPKTGEMLWHYPWVFAGGQVIICSQPMSLNEFDGGSSDQVLMSCGYGVGGEMLRIRRKGERFVPESVWTTGDIKSKFANMVVRDGYMYGLSGGILTCVDLETGKKRWKHGDGRYGHGQIILAGDVLLIQTEQRKNRYGDVVLVRASPDKFEQLAVLEALDHKTWNPPALVGNLLLVRNDREAACYELPLAREE